MGAARLTGFEDSNSFTNVIIDSKAAGQRRVLSNIGENPALLSNSSNGDSVPATVPEREPHAFTAIADPGLKLAAGSRPERSRPGH
jgi:hypothetical protein